VGDALQLRGFKPGGTPGQIPVKTSTEDFVWEWQTPPSSTPEFQVAATTLNVSEPATATISGNTITFGIPRGPTGPMGQPGQNGTNGTNGTNGQDGAPGQNAQVVVLTLAEYLALTPEQQMDGTWYVVPKT
jgi:hypothetical protein